MTKRRWKIEGALAKSQRDAFCSALEECEFNVSRTAQALRIGRSTAYALMHRYDIPIPQTLLRPFSPKASSTPLDVGYSETKKATTLGRICRKRTEFSYAAFAKALIALGEIRESCFNDDKVDSSSLEILLHIFVSENDGLRVNVASCTRVLNSTFPKASRRVALLENSGLVTSQMTGEDGRGPSVRLTDIGMQKVKLYLEAII